MTTTEPAPTAGTPPTTRPAASTIGNAVDCVRFMSDGTLDDFVRVVHPQGVNREASHEPPACRRPGPAGFHATAVWLRTAFPDLSFEITAVAADGDLVVVHDIIRGTHEGTMVFYGEDAEIADVFPPRHRPVASTQSHWFRMKDGLVLEHWANRDDLGMARQAGWVPPTPGYLIAMKRARRRALRA